MCTEARLYMLKTLDCGYICAHDSYIVRVLSFNFSDFVTLRNGLFLRSSHSLNNIVVKLLAVYELLPVIN